MVLLIVLIFLMGRKWSSLERYYTGRAAEPPFGGRYARRGAGYEPLNPQPSSLTLQYVLESEPSITLGMQMSGPKSREVPRS